jgi:hypothetical protein
MIAFAILALISSAAQAASPECAAPAVTTEIVQVTYEIPAPDPLKAFAQVTIPYQIVRDEKYGTQVSYTLPATLLGKDRTFDLKGEDLPGDGAYKLSGPNAEMSCSSGDTAVTCQVTHHNVSIDLPAVKAALDASALPQAQKDGRFELASFAARMGGDLVGVITLPREKK